MAKTLVGNLKYQDSVIELGQELDDLRDSTVPNTREVNDKPLSTDIAITKADIGLSNVNNTSDLQKPVSNATALVLATKADIAALTNKADLIDGLIPTSQIPAVALINTQLVANRAQMLALTNVQEGDIAIISGTSDRGTYILGPNSPTLFSSWVMFVTPTDLVSSVNGFIGPVVLGALDVGAVPLTRTISGKSLASDIVITPADIIKQWAGNNQRALIVTGPPGTPYSEVAAGSTTSGVSVVMRDSNNRFTVADPAVDTDATNKRASELTGDRTSVVSLGNISTTLSLSPYIRPQTVKATLTGNITAVTLPTPSASESFSLVLVLTQDATGGRTIVWPSGLSSDGVKPVLSTSPNTKDLITLFWDGANWWILQGARNGL